MPLLFTNSYWLHLLAVCILSSVNYF